MTQHNVPSHTGGLRVSSKNRVFAGVCGGLAEYFDMNATLLRILWASVTLLSGIIPGIAIYVLVAIVMKKGIDE